MSDWIVIEQLRINAEIGINADEFGRMQPLYFDLRLGFDNRVPARSDAIADTIDYAVVAQRLADHVASRRWNLVETLAESCAALLREEFGVRRLRLSIGKPQALQVAASVGVSIERDG